jgi:hypothetical protein
VVRRFALNARELSSRALCWLAVVSSVRREQAARARLASVRLGVVLLRSHYAQALVARNL